ncbi:putative DNA-directed RNA polymerase III subunit RPC3 [Blattamonas nauphoetae]|uniref:DNA-directed RNA polymerase III subunit RPC3 n=1 Tax=Blattamonas nauphoetae TaxID=2049346 RepID=A0ABQ9XWD9_9EUKA|nr:putative DNA-directed RNA polymerase III subunit RPC3 [Blattamonas nauphoetae]
MHRTGSKLISVIVLHRFGDNSRTLVEFLISNPGSTIHDLVESTKMSLRTIQTTLLNLIQHGVILFEIVAIPNLDFSPQPKPKQMVTLFYVDEIGTMSFLRYPRMMQYIQSSYHLLSSLFFDELIVQGRASFVELVAKIKERSSSMDPELHQQIIQRPTDEFWHHFSTLLQDKYVVQVSALRTTGKKSSRDDDDDKSDNSVSLFGTPVAQSSVLFPPQQSSQQKSLQKKTPSSSLAKGKKKRGKKATAAMVEDFPGTQCQPHFLLHEHGTYCIHYSSIFGAIKDKLIDDFIRTEIKFTIGTTQVRKRTYTGGRGGFGRGRDGGGGRGNTDGPFVRPSLNQQEDVVENTEDIDEKNRNGLAIWHILQTDDYASTKQIADTAQLNLPDVNRYLFALLRNNLVHYQEIPQTAENRPQKTTYLWRKDTSTITQVFLDRCYMAASRLLMRYFRELDLFQVFYGADSSSNPRLQDVGLSRIPGLPPVFVSHSLSKEDSEKRRMMRDALTSIFLMHFHTPCCGLVNYVQTLMEMELNGLSVFEYTQQKQLSEFIISLTAALEKNIKRTQKTIFVKSSKKSLCTPQQTYEKMLCEIDGITPIVAQSIIGTYPTFQSLFTAYNNPDAIVYPVQMPWEDHEDFLNQSQTNAVVAHPVANIQRGKQKKVIGRAICDRIRTIITSEDPSHSLIGPPD